MQTRKLTSTSVRAALYSNFAAYGEQRAEDVALDARRLVLIHRVMS